MNKKIILGLAAGLFLFITLPVSASTCTTEYGGRVTCVPSGITISKQVQNPVTHLFVANLTTTDAAFSPGSDVLFRLIIKNTGPDTLAPVTVKDIFPSHVTFKAGPGTFDKGSNTLTFTINSLTSGQEVTQEILAKVSDSSAFSKDKSFLCELNIGRVSAGNMNSEATSQLCIQTNVLGVTTIPTTGVNEWIMILPFLGLGLFGIKLVRKST